MNPPRAVYLDFPLGHTAGKPNDKALQRRIMIDTLSALDSIQVPGTFRDLPYQGASDDAWKDRVMRPYPDRSAAHSDERVARVESPQYQSDDDRVAALAALADGGCKTCIFLADRKS